MKEWNRDAMCQALMDIDRHCGRDAFIDPAKFRAAVMDFMHGGSLSRERNILIFAYNTGVYDRLLQGAQSSKEEQERLLSVVRQQLTDDYGFQEDACQCILDAFAGALGFGSPRERQPIDFGPYKWRVLDEDKDSNSTLLIADEVTDVGIPYHDVYEAVTWSNSFVRKWLNSTFCGRFSPGEQKRLLPRTTRAEPNNWYGTAAGASATDRVSLLSISEAVRYFGDSGSLSSRPDNQWRDMNGRRSCAIDDVFNAERRTFYKGTETWWWLRSPGTDASKAAYVNPDGIIFLSGELAFDDGGTNCSVLRPGVRPVICIRR